MINRLKLIIFTVLCRIKKFIHLPLRCKLIFIEACFLTGITRFSILFIPFRRMASIMGRQMAETPFEIDPKLLSTAAEVAWFVQRASSVTPWESKCFVQALTSQIMLRRRKIESTIYLGIAMDGKEKLKAHSWLRCGDAILTGDNERKNFKAIANFAWFVNAE